MAEGSYRRNRGGGHGVIRIQESDGQLKLQLDSRRAQLESWQRKWHGTDYLHSAHPTVTPRTEAFSRASLGRRTNFPRILSLGFSSALSQLFRRRQDLPGMANPMPSPASPVPHLQAPRHTLPRLQVIADSAVRRRSFAMGGAVKTCLMPGAAFGDRTTKGTSFFSYTACHSDRARRAYGIDAAFV